jgi:uncharacterized protein YjbI with pentapeptide repeats
MDNNNRRHPMRQRLSENDKRILIEAARIKRRLNEMADLSRFDVPEETKDERVRKAIVAGKIKNLAGADLSGLDLRGSDLRGADLRSANLEGTNLAYANLSDANLSDASLGGTKLWNSNLTRADLSGADLQGADLTDVDLTDVDIRDTIMPSNWKRITTGIPRFTP